MRVSRVLAAVLSLGVLSASGTAIASPTSATRTAHPHPASADAGYAAIGKHLNVVETWVTLPRASRFAREAGSVAASVQLWTASEVIDLRAEACTDATCQAGGAPAARRYHAVLAVYARPSHQLICSTTSTGAKRCPGQVGSFSRNAIRSGRPIELYLVYTIPYISVFAAAGDQAYTYPVTSEVPAEPRLDFTQARIAAEFGGSPWTSPALRGSGRVKVMSFDRPAPPPYFAEVANLKGKASGIAAPWWRHHKLTTSPGRASATASALWDDGYGFTVYLR